MPTIFSLTTKIHSTLKIARTIFNPSAEDSNSRRMQVCSVRSKNRKKKTSQSRKKNHGTLSLPILHQKEKKSKSQKTPKDSKIYPLESTI